MTARGTRSWPRAPSAARRSTAWPARCAMALSRRPTARATCRLPASACAAEGADVTLAIRAESIVLANGADTGFSVAVSRSHSVGRER